VNERIVFPFYFPTTVMFADDNAAFLMNLSLQLDRNIAYKLFSSPINALIEINATGHCASEANEFFSRHTDSDDLTFSRQLIDLNLDEINRLVHDERRFAEVSVIVVDYAMPEMNGLDFLKNLKNPNIKRVLLTGIADEKIAVKAFNEGLIDRFILKSDQSALTSLNALIVELQNQYFEQAGKILNDALAIGAQRFLHDPAFANTFNSVCREHHIVEYYLCNNPDGMLLLDAQGVISRLVVYTDTDLQAQIEIADEQNAPQAMLEELKRGNKVPYFWKNRGLYHPDLTNWDDYLHVANKLQGKQTYHYALVKGPDTSGRDAVLPYSEFLDRLDQHNSQVEL
jgi:CheY-like chemotaxis protein